MSATISSTSSANVYQTKQTPRLPDDFYTTQYPSLDDMPTETARETDANSAPATVWGNLQIGDTTVTIYNEGGVAYSDSDLNIDIDWNKYTTAEDRAAAIMAKYGGDLTVDSLENGSKSITAELMSKMFSSDALANRMFTSSSGENLQDSLVTANENDANRQKA